MKKEKYMFRLAVVGTGKIAQEILPFLYDMKEIDLVFLCGTQRSSETVIQLGKAYQIPHLYTDYEQLLADIKNHSIDEMIDGIYLATPNHLHFSMAAAALNCGQNVILEKPFVSSYEDAKTLIQLAQDNHCFLAEAISNQYLPIYDKIRESLPLIGELKYVDCNFSQYSSRFDRFLAGEYFRVFDPKCDGGALMDLNVYNLHLIAGLFGAPKKICYFPNMLRGVDTSGVLHLSYPGFQCTCTAAKDSPGPSRFLLQGTEGYLSVEAAGNALDAPLYFYHQRTQELKELFTPAKEHRMISEFRAISRMILSRDFEECALRQKESLLVCKLLCEARNALLS